ncbi:phosphohistidine phosphatase SixA [Pasteurella multocida subsp. multocida str. HN06]|nr:phosphohistidine phosphatase SixA [Pasteurella multocida subsp. multocida str. HN06]
MDIFVMRHGEAEVMAKSDRERHLNRRGIQQAISQGEWLKSTMTVDKVLVSSYARAQQTFEQINGVYANQLAEKVETWDGITPYGNSHTVVWVFGCFGETRYPVCFDCFTSAFSRRNCGNTLWTEFC